MVGGSFFPTKRHFSRPSGTRDRGGGANRQFSEFKDTHVECQPPLNGSVNPPWALRGSKLGGGLTLKLGGGVFPPSGGSAKTPGSPLPPVVSELKKKR